MAGINSARGGIWKSRGVTVTTATLPALFCCILPVRPSAGGRSQRKTATFLLETLMLNLVWSVIVLLTNVQSQLFSSFKVHVF